MSFCHYVILSLCHFVIMSFCHYNNFVAIVANGSNPLLIVLNKVLLFTKRGRKYIFLAYPLFLFDLRTSVSNIS